MKKKISLFIASVIILIVLTPQVQAYSTDLGLEQLIFKPMTHGWGG
ncbi:hypothetical protein [Paenibacillus sp. GCM10012306]